MGSGHVRTHLLIHSSHYNIAHWQTTVAVEWNVFCVGYKKLIITTFTCNQITISGGLLEMDFIINNVQLLILLGMFLWKCYEVWNWNVKTQQNKDLSNLTAAQGAHVRGQRVRGAVAFFHHVSVDHSVCAPGGNHHSADPVHCLQELVSHPPCFGTFIQTTVSAVLPSTGRLYFL